MKIPGLKEDVKAENCLLIEQSDILSDLEEKRGTSLFLGRYSLKEVRSILRRRSFYREAKKRGLIPVVYDLDSSAYPPLQRLRIFHKTLQPDNLIVDLKIRIGSFLPKNPLARECRLPEFRFLILDWLTLQNPRLTFSQDRTPLPGQTHPGLNLGRKVVDLFDHLARLFQVDGLMAYPAYYHNALLFSRTFNFLNPAKRAEVLAVKDAFPELSFKQLAWAVFLNCLQDDQKRVYEWKAEEQVHPLTPALKSYLESRKYRETVKTLRSSLTFTLDRPLYLKRIGELFPHSL